jgi:hypothetical protein
LRWTITAVLLGICFIGCTKSKTEQAQPLPTRPRLSATEEFDLRSKCAELGDKMEPDYGVVGVALKSDMVTHYNPETNRCYVQFTATKNLSYNYPSTPENYLTTTVYDGQTKEQLVYAEQNGDKSHGMIWSRESFDERYTTFDKAQAEVDRLMGEEGAH